MAIDHRALQSFYDMWTPVMKTLPAVIDAAQREAELARSVAQKADEFERLKAACEEREAAAEAKIASANQRLNAAKEEHLEAFKAFKVELSEAKATVTKAKKDAAAKVEEHQSSIAAAQAEVSTALKNKASVLAGLDAEADIRKNELKAEIEAMEARRDAIQVSIDALRQQILG